MDRFARVVGGRTTDPCAPPSVVLEGDVEAGCPHATLRRGRRQLTGMLGRPVRGVGALDPEGFGDPRWQMTHGTSLADRTGVFGREGLRSLTCSARRGLGPVVECAAIAIG